MVTMRDRALIEARAKGSEADIGRRCGTRSASCSSPTSSISAFAVSVMLLIYYTAVGFSVIYLSTVFGFSVEERQRPGQLELGLQRHRA